MIHWNDCGETTLQLLSVPLRFVLTSFQGLTTH